MKLWAKWGEAGAAYSLAEHLVDTAAFAAALWDRWVPAGLAARLDTMCGGDGRAVYVAAAALHDLGKATPVFQGQLLSPRRAVFAGHLDELSSQGLTNEPRFPQRPLDPASRESLLLRRHEIASAVMLSRQYDDAGSDGVAAVVAGHHGRWNIPDPYDFDAPRYPCSWYRWLLDDPAWSAVRAELVRTVERTLGVDPDTNIDDPAAVPILTAMVCLADWLASDLATRLTEGAPRDVDDPGFVQDRTDRARDAIDDLLGTVRKPAGGFEQVFGFAPSRPVQQQLLATAPLGLRIVTVPTGDGKTEAALGHWMTNAEEGRGLYFALPTMATADAMFARVRRFFAHAPGPVSGRLAHSRAILNEFYTDPSRPLDAETYGEDGHGLQPADWFNGRHRGLLAPVTVGTADQLLLAALRHRFNFMRLLGAATKTVVFDEVHSYDTLMASLLECFLAWAGPLGIDVVLLSASLPQERTSRYVAAYTGADPTPPAGGWPYPGVVTCAGGDPAAADVARVADSGRARTVRLRYEAVDLATPEQTADVVRRIVAAHPGAKVGVIVNTVSRCQQVAELLLADGTFPVDVMHSRFPAAVRGRHVIDAVSLYGKGSTSGTRVCVATQVIEQSVDLDFDVELTDLCPAPALVQRAGRLHRHQHDPARRIRPAGITDPVVHVLHAADPADGDVHAHLPYEAALVVKTWRSGLDSGRRAELDVPGDVQRFVDDSHVGADEAMAAADDDPLVAALFYGRAAQQAHASRTRVPAPDELRRDPARGLTDFCSGDLDTGHYQTRWDNLARADVVLVDVDAAGAWHGPLPDRPDRDETLALLGATVTLSGRIANAVTADGQDAPVGWADQPLLAGLTVLDLSMSDRWELHPTLGFRANPAKPKADS